MIRVAWRRELIRTRKGMLSVMVGRKRKEKVRRKPSGRIAQTYVSPTAKVAMQPHRMLAPVNYREFPEAESRFGRMMLHGVVSPAQHEAGKRYREGVQAYLSIVLNAPAATPKSIAILGARGQGAEPPAHVVTAVKAAYAAAFEALSEAGYKPRNAVNKIAVYDQSVPDFDAYELLRRGLDRLIAHYGIDKGLKISSRAK